MRANPFPKDRNGKHRDDDGNSKHDGRGQGQRQKLQGKEIQHRAQNQKHRAKDQLQWRVRVKHAQALARDENRCGQGEMDKIAQGHDLQNRHRDLGQQPFGRGRQSGG